MEARVESDVHVFQLCYCNFFAMLVVHTRWFVEFQSHLVHSIGFIAVKINAKFRHNAAKQISQMRTLQALQSCDKYDEIEI